MEKKVDILNVMNLYCAKKILMMVTKNFPCQIVLPYWVENKPARIICTEEQ